IPFLGVNLGQVGFMADISPHSWKDQLAALLGARLEISRRMVLKYQLIRGEEVVETGPAVNEVVINRGQMARLINIQLFLPGGVRQDVRCDGMIFSSPTGSTAYCVSAGGPLVHQDMQAMIVTPICPFLHDFRPLVLKADSVLEAGLPSADAEAFVTVDGQVGFEIRKKDRLRVSRNPRDLTFVTCPDHSFISKLVAKRFLKRRG
ncbi:MAG: NAD(+)/NADH kinase, partial [Desulfonatronovibrionaceae bacterium]